MKRLIFLLVLLVLTACTAQSSVDLVPPQTLAAQTLAALPRTDTPIPPTPIPPSPTVPSGPPTPVIDLNLPGAYCLPTNTPRTTGLVTKVLDGDTIEVATTFQTIRVRYIGIDAPNIAATAGGAPEWQAGQSAGFNTNLVNGKNVILIQDEVDLDPAANTYLRYVIADNVFVNYELVRQGLARAASMPPNTACDNAFISAQVEAQGAVRGVWQPTPVPTWTVSPTPSITPTSLPATATEEPPCTCNAQKSCAQFSSQSQAQACYNYCLRAFDRPVLEDKNRNGRVCEGLP